MIGDHLAIVAPEYVFINKDCKLFFRNKQVFIYDSYKGLLKSEAFSSFFPLQLLFSDLFYTENVKRYLIFFFARVFNTNSGFPLGILLKTRFAWNKTLKKASNVKAP